GRWLYSSTLREIWASWRTNMSALLASSIPEGRGDGSCSFSGRGSCAMTFLTACTWDRSCRCWVSSSRIRRFAAARSSPRSVCGSVGSGVFARRFCSVLPPPSRFACALTSGLTGAERVFEFTRTTSSWVTGGRCTSGKPNRIDKAIPCRRMETPIASARARAWGSIPASGARTGDLSNLCRLDVISQSCYESEYSMPILQFCLSTGRLRCSGRGNDERTVKSALQLGIDKVHGHHRELDPRAGNELRQ